MFLALALSFAWSLAASSPALAGSATATTTTLAEDEWTWVGGAAPSSPEGIYGSLRTPASSNHPGARSSAMTWTDSNGNLWLFGGGGNDSTVSGEGWLNDLWEFNPTTGEWAWMAGNNVFPSCTDSAPCGASGVYGAMGIPSPSNIPGGRASAVAWTDHNGNLWLFGGDGFDSAGNKGSLNDLWEFDPTTNEWTWMGGGNMLPSCSIADGCGPSGVYGSQGTPAPANVPGGRSGGVGWTDSGGNLWLFGGSGFDSTGNEGNLSDLWEFNPTTKQWTWINGSSTVPTSCSPYTTCGQPGIYGTVGSPSAANVPGGRYGAVSWTDSTGNFWLFGGEVNYTYADGTHGDMNDLWKFSPTTKEWTWMGGNDSPLQSCNGLTVCSPLPVYGLWQTPSAVNIPGAREDALAWVDGKGNVWLFGGYGVDSTGSLGDLNDLWEFNPSTNEWAWMSGSTLQGQYGSEGTQGIASFQNAPGGRNEAAGWTDGSGNLWLIGGYGYSPQEGFVPTLGDFWEFQLNVNGVSAAAAPTISPAGGTYTAVQSVTLSDSTPGAAIYYMVNSNAPPTEYTGPIAVNSSETIQAIAVASGYANSSAVAGSYVLNLPPPPAPNFNPPAGTYYGSQSISISDAESYATIYYTTDGTTPTTQSSVYTNPIFVQSFQTLNAIAIVSGGNTSPVASGTYNISPVPADTWTYVSGTNALAQTGIYGMLGSPLAGDYPGSRFSAVGWLDSNGNTWVFGGHGFDANGSDGWLNDLWMFSPGSPIQDGVWTWMGGSNTVGQLGIYGTLGKGSKSNIPGSREGSATWTDQTGNLWLFGGYGTDAAPSRPSGVLAYLNDLWEYSPGTGIWTWVAGSGTSTYFASAEGYGQVGVYGTLGSPTEGSVPGGREFASTWVDTRGNLWLFGGYGIDAAGYLVLLNDLWEFNTQTNQWIWMGGTPAVTRCYSVFGECGQLGVYGTLGTPSASNVPGGRQQAATWTDRSGNFWLLGGIGIDSSVENGLANNDLWMYSPANNQWTWMSGSSAFSCPYDSDFGYNVCESPPSMLGTLGVPASGNTPGGRSGSSTWVDTTGNFWLFGSGAGGTNDMWVYRTSIGQWAWMGGDYTVSNCSGTFYVGLPPLESCDGNLGMFGPQYMDGVGYVPGARSNAVSWSDKAGYFWLFSGAMYDLMTSQGGLGGPVNDLWQFRPSASTLPPAATPIFSLIPGTYTSGGPLTISNGMSNASIYYTTDGSTPSSNSTVYAGPINFNSSLQMRAIAVAPGYVTSGVAHGDFTLVQQSPPPTFSVAAGAYSGAQTVALSDATPYYGMIYYTTDGSDPTSSGTAQLYSQPLTVSSSETVNAIEAIPGWAVYEGSESSFDGIATPGASVLSPVATATYNINLPQAATPTFSVPAGTYASTQTETISDATAGATIYYTTDGTTPTTKSTVYAGPISVAATETIQAIATATGYTQSALAAAAYTINLPPPSFTVSGTAVTVLPGATSGNTSTVTVTPTGGFIGSLALTAVVTSSPAGAVDPPTVSFGSTGTVNIAGTTDGTATLAISTTAPTSAALAHPQRPGSPWYLTGGTALACLLLFGIPARRRTWRTMLGMLALLVTLAGGLASCSGSAGNNVGGGGVGGTTAGTYTVTVTATSATTSATGMVTLTVQ